MDEDKEKQYIQAQEILNKRLEFKDAEIAALQATIKELLSKPNNKGE